MACLCKLCKQPIVNNPSSFFPCPSCNFVANNKNEIKLHYIEIHKYDSSKTKYNFDSVEQFKDWKDRFCQKSCVDYKLFTRRMLKNGARVEDLKCSRDGFYTRSVHDKCRKRALKQQLSNKMNGHCPSCMRVEYYNDGSVEVDFIEKHFGHEKDPVHVRCTETEKKIIACKLKMHVPTKHIIKDAACDPNCSKKMGMLTSKQINNICNEYAIKNYRLHVKDDISVHLWTQGPGKDIVRYYKEQTSVNSDYYLVLMTQGQMEILKNFGKHCVCIDGTHGVNDYGFPLFTLLVKDEMSVGIPVAFFISSSSDTKAMEVFFSTVKECLQEPLKTNVFMTDMDNTFYNAWETVMGPVEHRLYCSWHVKRAWFTNTSAKIKNKDLAESTRKELFELQETMELNDFQMKLELLGKNWKENVATKEFGKYFMKYYGKNAEQWAYCHRKGAGINTNMSLETFHKHLKIDEMEGKKCKRLDDLIHHLIEIVTIKFIRLHQRRSSAQLTQKICNLRKSHKKAEGLSFNVITKDGDEKWKVKSMNRNVEYTIKISNKLCNCLTKCVECELCIHSLICTCPENEIKANMCKHIHLLGRFLKHENVSFQEEKMEVDIATDIQKYIKKPVDEEVNISIEEKKDIVLKSVNEAILSTIEEGDEYKKLARKLPVLIKSAIFKERKQNFISDIVPENIKKEPKNKNVTQQRRILTEKKKTAKKSKQRKYKKK